MREGRPEICIADGPLQIIDGDRGKNYPTQGDFSESGYCLFLNAGNVTSNGFSFSNCAFVTRERDELLNKGRLRRQDSVLTTRGTVGNVAFFGNDVEYDNLRINSGMVILRPDQHKLDPYFLYLFLRSSLFDEQVKGLTSGSAQPQLPIRDIRRVRLALPPLPEQRAIAATLGALDDKIELNRRMNETLEAMARALFRDWFVDFGPTRAKMAQSATESGIGAKPETALPAPYLSPALWSLFPDRLDDAGKPEGWEMGSIYHFADVIYGAPFKSKQFNKIGEGRPLARIRDLPKHKGGQHTTETHNNEHLINPGDIVVGMDGEFRAYIWRGVPTLMNQRICSFAPKSSFNRAFVWLSLFPLLHFYETTAIATTVIHLGKGDIDKFEVRKSPQDIMNAFAGIVEPTIDRIVANEQESRTLAQTRDLLLPRLMSGELRVAESARAVEEVL